MLITYKLDAYAVERYLDHLIDGDVTANVPLHLARAVDMRPLELGKL